jgi:hypothetical protein
MNKLKGYALVTVLRREAEEIANGERAALVAHAADVIAELIEELKRMQLARQQGGAE